MIKYIPTQALLTLGLSFVISLVTSHAMAQEQIQYDWLTGSDITGSVQVTIDDDGHYTTSYRFNDRGRGPDLSTQFRLDKRGLVTQFKASGLNYSKAPVDEQFIVENNIAKWSSSIEQGQRPVTPNTLYLPVNSSPFYNHVLLNALLKSPDQSIELYPNGRASLKKLNTVTIEHQGNKEAISLFEISGFDSTPQYLWLDARQEFFGTDLNWFSVIKKGYKDHAPLLKIEQEKASKLYQTTFANAHSEFIKVPIVIQGARIFDSYNKRLTTRKSVIIENGRISDIRSVDAAPPDNAFFIDGQGKTLLPSLWDMHAHMFAPQFINYVVSGVLNVRDMANDPEFIEQAQQQIAAHDLIGPDIYPMGFIDKKGPFSAPTGRLAENLDQALGFVDEYAQRGYVGIKLYSSIEPAWVAPLAARAHRYKMSVAGHIPSGMSAEQAVFLGYDEITHINMVLLQLIGDSTVDTRTPQRFIVPGERSKEIELYNTESERFFSVLKRKKIALDPTLVIFIDLFKNSPGDISIISDTFADKLPAVIKRSQINQAGFNIGKEADFAQAADVSMRIVKRLHDQGTRILPGTDNTLPGFTLISELESYAKAGISNEDILYLATLGSAEHLNQDQQLGSVDIGKKAHLFLVNGDPTADISALRRVDKVIKNDAIYTPRKILTAQGFVPFD